MNRSSRSRWRRTDCCLSLTVKGVRGWKHVAGGKRRGRNYENKCSRRFIVNEIDGPSQLTRENHSDYEVHVAGLTSLKDPYQFFFKAKLFNSEALFFAVLVAVIFNFDRKILPFAGVLPRCDYIHGCTH